MEIDKIKLIEKNKELWIKPTKHNTYDFKDYEIDIKFYESIQLICFRIKNKISNNIFEGIITKQECNFSCNIGLLFSIINKCFNKYPLNYLWNILSYDENKFSLIFGNIEKNFFINLLFTPILNLNNNEKINLFECDIICKML